MPQRSIPGGVGAIGSSMARFFHPSQKIREKWPHEERRRLAGVLVTGEGIWRVHHKDQMCYLVRINDINDSTIIHIVKRNLRIESPPAIPFESKTRTPIARVNPPPVPGEAVNPERILDRNVAMNIEGYVDHDSRRH